MEKKNFTPVTEFVLLGLTQRPELQPFLSVTFFIVYINTWLVNVIIITTVISDYQLHTSMYILLANLAFLDICDSSVNTPKLLSDLLSQHKTISFNECILQMFFLHFFAGAMGFCLVGMAVDRYVAIYKPLRYLTIMNRDVCVRIVALAWLVGLAHSAVQTGLLLQLPFCGPNILDNFYCDVPQVIKLACTNTHLAEMQMNLNSGLAIIIIFIILLISYAVILIKIRTHVTEGKHKALSTCGTQITVMCFQFIPSIFIYAWPIKQFALHKVVSVIYSTITPMLNPMVYTLRNAEMKNAIRRLLNRMLFSRQERQT
ncbi:olfactory receptor 4D1-like [Mauremys reevesii]|uniref:olfactory receptor 4D1-like n=1 Tax=Mauremys reevesii TaxID=260615 RepID=UPI00193F9F80|nr:olfactory receptor 4D1-like [Mauremys reevesii]XP_039357606.1 olfactory receptor 4D1-like [Mauremys reevesii]XP_039357607.1 olfactory receptor 4D1-like [Mauremys reevesii]XP_039357608.1 olfactory receptor 4D1-like [Mauremys reevesii]XP_039357609.1 olfactory receptor 4D1-like [Mauremys reevesii]XP_039357610.1 olfactory receptor 4D1-like [Mauremys reevesii]